MSRYGEPLLWTLALVALFFLDPSKESPSLCLGRLVGWEGCPGCGIGHSMHYALHGAFRQSFQEHILGIPATIGLLGYIGKRFLNIKKPRYKYEPTTTVYDPA